ncbi:hypothetical protein ABK040_000386 [Willaertia magna]
MVREIGVIFECLMCETYFIQSVKLIDLSEQRKKSSTSSLNKKHDLVTEIYIETQNYFENHPFQCQICPTCNELIYEKKYKDFLISVNDNVTLSLCKTLKFLTEKEIKEKKNQLTLMKEELKKKKSLQSNSKNLQKEEEEIDPDIGVPLYLDKSDTQSKKPKWELVFGIGPSRLELDSSQSGRIYKPSFKALHLTHISTNLFKNSEEKPLKGFEFEEMCCNVMKSVGICDDEPIDEKIDFINSYLLNNLPLFDNYDKIKGLLEERIKVKEMKEREEEEEERALQRRLKNISLSDVLTKRK